MKNAVVLMVGSGLVSSIVMAQSPAIRYTATLAQPVASKQFIANSNIWRCDGTACVLSSYPNHADSLHSCHELRRQVGVLTAYGTAEKPLDADTLAKCNAER